jgi:hypothetical protein
VAGYWSPHVVFGAPGCPGPLGLGVAAAIPNIDKSRAAEAIPIAILLVRVKRAPRSVGLSPDINDTVCFPELERTGSWSMRANCDKAHLLPSVAHLTEAGRAPSRILYLASSASDVCPAALADWLPGPSLDGEDSGEGAFRPPSIGLNRNRTGSCLSCRVQCPLRPVGSQSEEG